MFTHLASCMNSFSASPNRWLVLVVFGILLISAVAAEGQAVNVRRQAPAETELVLVPASMDFDPAKATSVRILGGEDPDKLPVRGADKAPTPGWATLVYETAEGNFPADHAWNVFDANPTSGLDYWDDVSCRSFAGSWSVWCADIGVDPDCTSYDDDMVSWMIFGPFSLADAIDARVEFRVWSQTEAPDIPFDSVFWGASANGTNFSGTRLASNTSGWMLETFDLTNVPMIGDLRGDPTVWFAFVFTSDSSVNSFEGTYLDEIVIEKLTASPLPDLEALDVYFRSEPGGGGSIVANPAVGDVLYPHFDFRIDNDSVSGKIWEIELDGAPLCFFSIGSPGLTPGPYTGSCGTSMSLTPGMHTLHGEVDPDQTITESNGGNNDAFRSYDVPGGLGDTAGLIVPGFEVDLTDPQGASTLFAVRNHAGQPRTIMVDYYAFDTSAPPLRTDTFVLQPQQTLAQNVRFDVSGLFVQGDVAQGLIVINQAGGGAADIEGDYFRIDFANDFATGDRLVRPVDFCTEQEIRFVDFGSGTVLRILLDQPPVQGSAFSFTAYAESGQTVGSGDIFTSSQLLRFDLGDLVTAENFGTLVFDFANSGGGWVSARYSAFGRFSVELNSACRD